MNRYVRDIEDLVSRLVLEHCRDVTFTLEKGKHIKIWLGLGGQSRLVVASASPSDRRSRLNLESTLKAAIRELKDTLAVHT